MEKSRGIANFAVRYNSDPVADFADNHKSAIIFLTDTDERNFNDIDEAITFFSECISPITKIEELVPELKNCKKFNYMLPDRNIKPKHQLSDTLDTSVFEGDVRW